MYIADMDVGDRVEGFFILQSAYSKLSANGKPFLSMVLEDCSGTIESKVWDYSGPVGLDDVGEVLKIKGAVTEFRGSLQLICEKIRLAEPGDKYDPANLVPTAPIDVDASYNEVLGYVESMEDEDYAAVCRKMLEVYGEQFRTIPAAKSVHHEFLSGLLMHTLNMLRIADFLAGIYSQVIDRSLLMAGTLLHDFAKCEEFETSTLGLVTDYSVKGELLGHLVMGSQAVAEAAKELGTPQEKAVLLQHMLLSHHGQPDYGAAVRPLCAESELLSQIDMLDSRMEIYRSALKDLAPGQFSGRIYSLDKCIYKHG